MYYNISIFYGKNNFIQLQIFQVKETIYLLEVFIKINGNGKNLLKHKVKVLPTLRHTTRQKSQ